tara:strand:- start:673 stop:828 length:156 start_codon:yes stop_codon:yes gene_type:complete
MQFELPSNIRSMLHVALSGTYGIIARRSDRLREDSEPGELCRATRNPYKAL